MWSSWWHNLRSYSVLAVRVFPPGNVAACLWWVKSHCHPSNLMIRRWRALRNGIFLDLQCCVGCLALQVAVLVAKYDPQWLGLSQFWVLGLLRHYRSFLFLQFFMLLLQEVVLGNGVGSLTAIRLILRSWVCTTTDPTAKGAVLVFLPRSDAYLYYI